MSVRAPAHVRAVAHRAEVRGGAAWAGGSSLCGCCLHIRFDLRPGVSCAGAGGGRACERRRLSAIRLLPRWRNYARGRCSAARFFLHPNGQRRPGFRWVRAARERSLASGRFHRTLAVHAQPCCISIDHAIAHSRGLSAPAHCAPQVSRFIMQQEACTGKERRLGGAELALHPRAADLVLPTHPRGACRPGAVCRHLSLRDRRAYGLHSRPSERHGVASRGLSSRLISAQDISQAIIPPRAERPSGNRPALGRGLPLYACMRRQLSGPQGAMSAWGSRTTAVSDLASAAPFKQTRALHTASGHVENYVSQAPPSRKQH